MEEPLKTWTCDRCGEVIEQVDHGYVIWRHLGDLKEGGFLIIHQGRCDADRTEYQLSMPLSSFLGHDGLAHLLPFLSAGPFMGHLESMPEIVDFDEYVDFVRRVQTPYYEQARVRFGEPDVQYLFGDSNQYSPYMQEPLKRLVEEGEEQD